MASSRCAHAEPASHAAAIAALTALAADADSRHVYLSSVFMWPIVKFADQPYYGADENAPRHRSRTRQGSRRLRCPR